MADEKSGAAAVASPPEAPPTDEQKGLLKEILRHNARGDEVDQSLSPYIKELSKRWNVSLDEKELAEINKYKLGLQDKPYEEPFLARHAGTIGQGVGAALGEGWLSVPLAGIGGAVGSVARDLYGQHQTGIPPNPRGVVEGAATSAAEGMAGQTIGLGIGKGISKLSSKFAPYAKYAKDTTIPPGGLSSTSKVVALNKSIPGGLGLTASELTNRPVTLNRMLQSLSGYSYMGGVSARASRERAAENIQKAVDEWLGTLANKRASMGSGKLVRNALESASDTFKREAAKLYGTVDTEAAGVTVDMNPVKLAMQNLKEQLYGELEKAGYKVESSGAKKFFDVFERGGENMSFNGAKDLRSFISDMQATSEDLMPKQIERIKAIAKNELSKAMETSSRRLNGRAYEAYQEANNFYKVGADTFQADAVAQLLKRGPEHLVDAVPPGSPSRAWEVRNGLTKYLKYAEPAEKKQMNAAFDTFREQWARKHLLGIEGEGASPDLLGIKDRIFKADRQTLNALYRYDPKGQEFISNMRTLGEAMSRQARMNHSQVVRWGEGLGQAMSMMRATLNPSWGNLGLAGAVPAAEASALGITKILYNQKATKILLEGLDPTKGRNRFWTIANAARALRVATGMPYDERIATDKIPVKADVQKDSPVKVNIEDWLNK